MPRASPNKSRPARKARPAQAQEAEDVRRALAAPPPTGHDSLRFPTFSKYQVMSRVVHEMTVAEKRNVFQYMRELMLAPEQHKSGDHHYFMPTYGITLGEFSMFHL